MNGEVCIANIGPRQRRLRLLGGIVGAVGTVGYLGVVIALSLPRPFLLAVFFPAWGAALGFLQYMEKT